MCSNKSLVFIGWCHNTATIFSLSGPDEGSIESKGWWYLRLHHGTKWLAHTTCVHSSYAEWIPKVQLYCTVSSERPDLTCCVPSFIDSNILPEFFVLYLKAFIAYGFRVAIFLRIGPSSNLTLLKIFCGMSGAALPVDNDAENLFTNPEDTSGNPIFARICPSHQVNGCL